MIGCREVHIFMIQMTVMLPLFLIASALKTAINPNGIETDDTTRKAGYCRLLSSNGANTARESAKVEGRYETVPARWKSKSPTDGEEK